MPARGKRGNFSRRDPTHEGVLIMENPGMAIIYMKS
jgi:hypothetical protein